MYLHPLTAKPKCCDILLAAVFDECAWDASARASLASARWSPQEDEMQLPKHLLKTFFRKAALAALALAAFLLFAGAPSAKANGWDDCNRRVAYAEWRLHQSIEYFGYYSPQARYWRHERHEAYEQLERYRRHEWRERARREHEWREHHRDYHGHRHYRGSDDWDRD